MKLGFDQGQHWMALQLSQLDAEVNLTQRKGVGVLVRWVGQFSQ